MSPVTGAEIPSLQEAVASGKLPPMSEPELDAYLYKTASRLVRDRWRRSQVDTRWRQGLPPRAREVETRADHALDMDRVLRQLRLRERAIVWLAYVEGRSHAEIAEIMSLKAASVRVLLFRARRKLAKILDDQGLTPEVRQ